MRCFHPLLIRQLKRAGIDIDNNDIDPAILKLLQSVSNGYQEADEGRYIVERSLDISSSEMNELRNNLQKERDILQSVMSEGMCVLDPLFNIKDVNITGSLMLCCSASITAGKHYSNIFKLFTYNGKEETEVTMDMLMDSFSKNKIFHCEKGLLKSCQGIETPISFSLNPLPYSNSGIFNGCVLVFRDISETLKYEQMMRDALIAAEQSNVAKTQFLANMSHEIRTPMNGILGMLQLLMHTSLDEKQNHYVQKGYECANYLLNLLGDILDFTKIEAGKIELEELEFNLQKEIESFMVLFAVQCKQKHIEFNKRLDNAIPQRLIGDPNRIRQIIHNLASNALKFTPSGGKISIEFNAANVTDDDIFLSVSISDTGIGIPHEAQLKIFNIFSQADESTTRKFGGTGLGLAISKQLVEQMGGTINLRSTEGQGTTFTFTVKLHKMKKVQESLEENETISSPTIVKANYDSQILIVEDDMINQEIARDVLTLFGCHVKTAPSGKQALKAVQEAKYDLIFMDCQMPEMDGFETTEAIRRYEALHETDDKTIIIALTANAQKDIKKRCLAAGMNDCLMKPLKVQEISGLLQKYLHSSSPPQNP
jgi:signal transduction histidine kinase/ActR/RegA family two-component response regulator